jgi:hypothetical protein
MMSLGSVKEVGRLIMLNRYSLMAFAVILLLLTAGLVSAAEEKKEDVIQGHVYCVLPTADGVKLEPGVCPGGKDHGAHVVKTPDGQLILLQETEALKDLPKLTVEQKKNVTITGKREGPTVFTPETLRVR